MKKTFDKTRPLSWSAISSFEWDPESWYKKYVMNERDEPNEAMKFGNVVGQSFATASPLAPVVVYPEMEYKLEAKFGKIPLVGYIDSWDPEKKLLREYKTSSNAKKWNQKSVNEHGQLTMYALMLYLSEKIKPEDITMHLDYIPVRETGDFGMEIVTPVTVHTYETKRTMADVLRFGQRINATYQAMEDFCEWK